MRQPGQPPPSAHTLPSHAARDNPHSCYPRDPFPAPLFRFAQSVHFAPPIRAKAPSGKLRTKPAPLSAASTLFSYRSSCPKALFSPLPSGGIPSYIRKITKLYQIVCANIIIAPSPLFVNPLYRKQRKSI